MAAQGYRGEPETKTKEDESNASLYIAVSMYIYFTVGTKGPWVMAFHQRRDDDDENKHAVGHRRNWTDVVVLGKNEMRAESASREPRKKKTRCEVARSVSAVVQWTRQAVALSPARARSLPVGHVLRVVYTGLHPSEACGFGTLQCLRKQKGVKAAIGMAAERWPQSGSDLHSLPDMSVRGTIPLAI